MRILHVIPSVNPASGGPAEGLKQLCRIYRMGGHEVEVASLDSPQLAESYNFPVRVNALGPAFGVYGYAARASGWFDKNLAKYDIVFIDGIWQYNALVAYRALARTNIPYAVYAHGMLDPYFKRRFFLKHLKKTIYWHLSLQTILETASAVLFTTEEEKILARQSFSRYRVHERIVPYGTFGPGCVTALAADEFLTRWPGLRGKRIAILMGRIHPKKGIDLLIEAFAKMPDRDATLRLVIAGPDSNGQRLELEVFAARLGVADKIVWTGMLEGSLKWGALSASEVFVLPSHQENFGLVVAEAMACGLPVIVSNKVNLWREVAEYGAGLVCDDTVEGTRAKLMEWQSMSEGMRAELRVKSRRCFDERFNYEVTAQRTLKIVEELARHSR